ncbi:hypothetical protein [Paracoccus alcaliphilus]|uniref:hypothetical protein n=1 Tax=Paracoccus alcaliphilus TaxID=34002 RepID=UPI0023500752|nr:hypothetical protein [Paracoccus alcaliphilus]WCR18718.1 hypothetical protein JHW40_03060 [Paracoccus alcaliphilus]WCR20905.1 hypothetical protein JHW40_23280 [Paracoccus alcaliphilus]
MPHKSTPRIFRPAVSPHEWAVILTVLGTYRHNKDFRKIHDRLTDEAAKAGIKVPQGLSQVGQH